MNGAIQIILSLYTIILKFYPPSFLADFGEEMQSVFLAVLRNAASKGLPALGMVCLRELRDFPTNVLRAHLESPRKWMHMRSLIDYQPFRSSVRRMFGLGITLAVIEVIYLSFYFGYEQALKSFWEAPDLTPRVVFAALDLISYWLASLVGGILMAVIFKKQSEFRRFIIIGMLGWFIPNAIREIVLVIFNWEFSMEHSQFVILSVAFEVIVGAFLGVTIGIIIGNQRRIPLMGLYGAVAYPAIKFLSSFLVEHLLMPLPTQTHLPTQMLLYLAYVVLRAGTIYAIAGMLLGILLSLILEWRKRPKELRIA